MFRMHRLTRLFFLGKIDRSSDLWNKAYSVALVPVHEGAETILEEEAMSFEELPGVFGNNHREFVVRATALVEHHMLLMQDAEQMHWLTVKC